MMESVYCFDVPFQLMQLFIGLDKAFVVRLDAMGAFLGQVESGKFLTARRSYVSHITQLAAHRQTSP